MTIPVLNFTLKNQLLMTEPMMQFTVLYTKTTKHTYTSQEGSRIVKVW